MKKNDRLNTNKIDNTDEKEKCDVPKRKKRNSTINPDKKEKINESGKQNVGLTHTKEMK